MAISLVWLSSQLFVVFHLLVMLQSRAGVSANQSRSFRKENRDNLIFPTTTRTKLKNVNRGNREVGELASQPPTYATTRFKPVFTALPKSGDRSFSHRRPNIVLILTDDQDVELGSLQFMPKVNKHLMEAGVSYNNGFVSTPMCCPSRSSLLTGLYVHNHKVFTNNDNCSSTYWQKEHETRSFGAYLQDSGYSTGYFGKYLNKYAGQHIPPGWGEWQGLLRNSRFYNYSLNVNGHIHHHGMDYRDDYLPDLITNRSLSFIKASKDKDADTPVLAVLSFPGPHGPEDAAPQYQHLFFNVTTHHTPAYDFSPNPDKQWILRRTDKMLPIHKEFTDLLMTKRLQTLQSVDEAVERLVSTLEEIGELENTYIFYTSDHGYHLGQYGLVKGKAFPFDVDTKVPFLVRGPGIPKGEVRNQIVGNIDLAPTFLDIAGLQKPPHMDGESIMPTLAPNSTWRSAFLLERGKMTFERYAKVSNSQSRNSSATTGGGGGGGGDEEDGGEDVAQQVDDLLRKNRLTKQERLEIECKKSRYQSPCGPHQVWYCQRMANSRMRMTRCRHRPVEKNLRRQGGSGRNQCYCEPGEIFGWKYTKLDRAERRLQKQFLKRHLPDASKVSKKFLKTLPRAAMLKSRHVRAAQGYDDHLYTAPLEDLDGIFESVHRDEIQEVDGLVEDIAEEIRDLHNLGNQPANSSNIPCWLQNNSVVCTNDVTSDKKLWEDSRTTIRHQIQRLRAQLLELKQIRKYLRLRRPRKRRPQTDLTYVPTSYRSYGGSDDAIVGLDELPVDEEAELCLCEDPRSDHRRRIKEERREEKRALRMLRREKRRQRRERREKKRVSPKKHDHCKADVKMNCFSHDNNHWKTAPLWNLGPFCACTNSNNNTYWCVRNANETHNYLYCEFVTGMITYFDMRVDPHQLRNVLHTLTDAEVNYMHNQVIELREHSAEQDYYKRSRPDESMLRHSLGRKSARRWRESLLQREENNRRARKWRRRNSSYGRNTRG